MSKGVLSIVVHGSTQYLLLRVVPVFHVLRSCYKHHSRMFELEIFNFIDLGFIQDNVLREVLRLRWEKIGYISALTIFVWIHVLLLLMIMLQLMTKRGTATLLQVIILSRRQV